MEKELKLIKNDSWLKPFEAAIVGRHQEAIKKESELTQNKKFSLSDFASGYLYFGLHRTKDGWVLREWAPNATEIYLIGDFSDWKKKDSYKLVQQKNGIWEINLSSNQLNHGDLDRKSVV